MPRRTPRKRPYTETQIYADASDYLFHLAHIVKNMPKFIQFSIGEEMLKDATRVVQLMKLCYEAVPKYKLMYSSEAWERMKCLEVSVNMMYQCRFISKRHKDNLYFLIGSMEHQMRAWREKIKKDNNIKEDDCQFQ